MVTSLRDIPGAQRRRPGRRPPTLWSDGPRPGVLLDPGAGGGRGFRGARRRRPARFDDARRRRLSPADWLLVAALGAVGLFLLRGAWSATRVKVASTGLPRNGAVTFGDAARLDVHLQVKPRGGLPSSKLLLDGQPLTKAFRTPGGYEWHNEGPLTAGAHRLELEVPRPMLGPSRFTWKFVVDATPPTIRAPATLAPHKLTEAVRISGSVDTDATLTANGEKVKLDRRGNFTLAYPRPPAGPITLVAKDAAGYVVKHEVFVPIARPTVHGVHMSAISWRTPDLKAGVMDLVNRGIVNTIELDLKDESGEVGYDSQVPLARDIGAVKRYYDLKPAVQELHQKGVRVIGRIVVFRDPILSEAAWKNGNQDWVLQKPDGTPQGAYGGFTNMAARAVQQYNLDIASEAANAGVDEILWDYIRRPEGELSQMVFKGMPSTDDAVQTRVVDFLSRAQQTLHAKGVLQGASVFGIAAARPTTIGQNVPDIARHVDYLAPMVYPSLWVPGEYRVNDPPREPFAIVVRSLEDFKAKAEGTAVGFTPWLQDFSLGTATYRDVDVAEQIRGTTSLGIQDWLLWSPRVVYHTGKVQPLSPASS